MGDFIKNLLDIKKVPASILVIIGVICSLLLFLPTEILKRLSVFEFKIEYGKYVGIVFLCCLGLLITMLFKWFVTLISNRIYRKKRAKFALEMLQHLDWEEVRVLREFYINRASSIKIPIDNPVVAGLINKGILSPVSSIGSHTLWGMFVPYRVSENVKRHVTDEILGFPNRELTPAEQAIILNERPQWARELEAREKERAWFSRY